jgi:hypothetical protein
MKQPIFSRRTGIYRLASRRELHADGRLDLGQREQRRRERPYPIAADQPGRDGRDEQRGLLAVELVRHEHHEAPHAHVDGEAGADEERHGHGHRQRHEPAEPAGQEVPGHVCKHREREEPGAQLQAVLGQRRETLHADDGHVAVDERIRCLPVPVGVAHVERLVEEEEGERREDAAHQRADDLPHQHRPRRRQRQVARFEVVHQIGGDEHQLLHQAAPHQPGDHAVVLARPRREYEQPDLAVVVPHVHVSQAGAVGVAEPQRRRQHVRHDHVVPLHLPEHERDGDHRDDAEQRVSGVGHPGGDVVPVEHLVALHVVQRHGVRVGHCRLLQPVKSAIIYPRKGNVKQAVLQFLIYLCSGSYGALIVRAHS